MIVKKQIIQQGIFSLLTIAIFFAGISLTADDIEAQAELEKGKKEFAEGSYYDAGKAYLAAELYADSPDIKFTALEKAADAFGKSNHKYKQFQCLEKLIAGFPDKIDFSKIIQQEYKIGNDFTKGHRDIPLYWLPWIKDTNKAPEIYETILKQAPFAKFAPELKLRLGRMYIEEGENEKALKTLRTLIKQHPKSAESKFARFELANALVQMSGKAGDGDGVYAREAEDVLKDTLKLYPKDPETTWIKTSMKETDDVRAERLYNLAEFYQSRENPDAAKRYFHDLLSRFPDSKYVKDAEKHLVELSDDYKPRKTEKEKHKNLYPILEMQDERRVILVAPEASGGKWLLPIENLDLDSKHADAEYKARKEAKEEARKKAEAKRAAEIAARKAARKKQEAEQKAKKKAEKEQKRKIAEKKEAQRIKEAAEKTAKLQAAAEKAVKEKAEAEKRKKEKEAAAKKKAEGKAKSLKKEGEDSSKDKIQLGEREKGSEKSSVWKYMIPIILILLLIIAALILYLKKKQQR